MKNAVLSFIVVARVFQLKILLSRFIYAVVCRCFLRSCVAQECLEDPFIKLARAFFIVAERIRAVYRSLSEEVIENK